MDPPVLKGSTFALVKLVLWVVSGEEDAVVLLCRTHNLRAT